MGVIVGVSDAIGLEAIRADIYSWDLYGSRADLGSAIIDYSKLLSRNRSCEASSVLRLVHQISTSPNRPHKPDIYLMALRHPFAAIEKSMSSTVVLVSHQACTELGTTRPGQPHSDAGGLTGKCWPT